MIPFSLNGFGYLKRKKTLQFQKIAGGKLFFIQKKRMSPFAKFQTALSS